jgi:FkbM family methyltransferase
MLGLDRSRYHPGMHRFLRDRARRYVSTHRRSRLVAMLARYCRTYVTWYDNQDYDARTNGEYRILQALAGAHPRVLFDVGANVGDWTRKAKQIHPAAAVHAFEIVAETYSQLEDRVGHLRAVVPNPVGLSDTEGAVEIHTVAGRSDLASTTGYTHTMAAVVVTGHTITGDSYVARHSIERIDLLKIDVEGTEGRVLRGFERTLARGAIGVIQFEYGLSTVVGGSLLGDLYSFLEGHGFVVGKVYPDHVDLRPFRATDEDCRGPNFLAVRRDRPDLIRLLG